MERRETATIVVGIALCLGALLQVGLAWLVHPRWAAGLAATMAAELVTGRESAIPLALSQGVPPAWIALTSILQNLGLAAVLVTLAGGALARTNHANTRFGRALANLTNSARAQSSRTTAWAIFVFMLIPFLANGPILAGTIGVLAGINRRRLAIAVTCAVILTATAWSFAYSGLAAALARVDPRLAAVPSIVAIGLVVLACVRFVWLWRKNARVTTLTEDRV